MIIICKLIILLFLTTVASNATIFNTKHNLSSTGSGSVKATSETEVCAFCHIPHSTQSAGSPLWNRSASSASFTMYDSTYLRRAGYPAAPSDLGSSNETPGAISRQCMSCHDGTVAVGDIYLLRGTVLGTALDMAGLTGGMMTGANEGFIGTDLSKHHPVGYEYDTTPTVIFDDATRTMELKATPDSPIKLREYAGYAGKKYVECTSCHDPHKENGKFLRVDTEANHAQNVKTTCTSCHEKDNWTGSIHDMATNLYTDTDSAVNNRYGTKKVGDLGCVNCHTPHDGEGSPYLLRKVEENTCFQGAASTVGNASCHGTGGAKDIESLVTSNSSHPVTELDFEGKHSNLDVFYGVGVTRFPAGSKGLDWSDSKHIECVDCHNPHQAKAGTHAAGASWYPSSVTANSNEVSNVLLGVPGIEPASSSRWTQPTSFTYLKAAVKEYQICMKCHSYSGLGTVTEGLSTYPTQSAPGEYFTDQAFEFNPNNRSNHPVRNTLNNQTGSYAPKNLEAEFMRSPWNTNVGNQTMMCSDCHGAENEIGGDARGPHGSTHKYMLKGPNNNWPKKPNGDYFIRRGIMDGTIADDFGTADGLFCMNCHVLDCTDVNFDNAGNAHCKSNRSVMLDVACVNCHVAVPHGSPISRLFGYYDMPEPYNVCNDADLPYTFVDNDNGYGSTNCSLLAQGFKKHPDAGNYIKQVFYSKHDDCNGGHDTNEGGYDSYP